MQDIVVNKEYVQSLVDRVQKLYDKMHIEDKKIELEELKLRQSDSDLWNDIEKANKLMYDISSTTNYIESYEKIKLLVGEIEAGYELGETNKELSKMSDELEKELSDIEFYFTMSDEEDRLNAIIKITAGAGGTEAQDWAQMLSRMYILYCTNKFSKKPTVVNFQEASDKIGIKTISLRVEADYAYGLLKAETGVHRLVRVSPYNAQGKRMTSFASVFVYPEIDDSINITLDKSKLSFDYFRSSGAGGQNVNKVNSGVRARYLYTDPDTGIEEEILVENTETRDQPKNKERAINNLKSILYKKEIDRKNKKKQSIEDSKGDNGWGNQIRSYVLDDSRVKDHRTGFTVHNPDAVLNGDLDGFIKAYLLTKL